MNGTGLHLLPLLVMLHSSPSREALRTRTQPASSLQEAKPAATFAQRTAFAIRRRRADRRRPLAALSCFLHSQPEVLHNLHSQPHHSCKRSASTKQRRRQLHHCSCCGAHSAICVERSKHANMLVTWNAKCMCMHTPWCGRLCLCLLHNTHNHYITPINK